MERCYGGVYTQQELNIIDEIDRKHVLSPIKANLLVIMTVRSFYRSKADLAGILNEYPNLDNRSKLIGCIDECLREGYLSEKVEGGIRICYQSQDNLDKFLEQISSEEIREKLKNIKEEYQSHSVVTDFGLLSGAHSKGDVYIRFLKRLESAQREIWLPMLNTDAHEKTIEVLKERANSGVKVYILLAHYKKVVKNIRSIRESNIPKWVEAVKNVKNIEIRIYSESKYARLASTMLVDDRILRIPIYDPKQQKSTNGQLLEFYSQNLELNIVGILKDEIQRAWESSVSANLKGYRWFLFKYIQNKFTAATIGLIILIGVCNYITENSIIYKVFFDLIIADITYLIIKIFDNKSVRKRLKKIWRAIFQ